MFQSTEAEWSQRVAVAMAAGALLLVACGGGGESAPAASPTSPSVTSDASPAGNGGTSVTAALTEFRIELSQRAFEAGSYTFVAEEKGQAPHALSIEGPGVDTVSTPVIQPGAAAESLTVTLKTGTYELWCPVGSHRQQGMELTITVP
jgi:uncharacterized cupredoxin-like copper-binding protein